MKDSFRQLDEVEAIIFVCNELYGKDVMGESNLEKMLIELGVTDEG